MSRDISADSNDGNIAAPSTELLTEQTTSCTAAKGGNVGTMFWRNKFLSTPVVLIGGTLAYYFFLVVGSFIRILNLLFIGVLFKVWSPFDYLVKKGLKARRRGSQLIVSFGEMLIDFVPDVAGLSLAESTAFIKAPGGAPANVACAIAKLGGNSAFIGKVGDDEFGHMLVDILKKHDVNIDGVRFDEDARTALAFVTLKTNGEQEFMFYRNLSADMLLTESELNMGLIKQAKIFHYGSISLIAEPCKSAHMTAMETAKKSRGVLLSYDPNVRLPLWPSAKDARDAIMSIWDYADIIKVSDDEVAFLTEGDADQDDVVMSLWHDKLKLLVVTDGEKGCRYYTKNFRGRLPGFSVKTVDTTGAGDAFVGSLLVSIAKEEDDTIFSDEEKLKEALTLANACGALSTTQKGAIPALPTIADAQALIINANTSNEDI